MTFFNYGLYDLTLTLAKDSLKVVQQYLKILKFEAYNCRIFIL